MSILNNIISAIYENPSTPITDDVAAAFVGNKYTIVVITKK